MKISLAMTHSISRCLPHHSSFVHYSHLNRHTMLVRNTTRLFSLNQPPSVPPHNPKDDGKQHGLPDHTTQQQHQPATSPRRLQRLLYENIYTIPNMLSATRLLLSPYIGYLLVSQQNYTVAFGAFAVAGITDLLDGWIARRFNSRTVLGSVLDPLADKSLMTVLTVSLTANQLLPLPLAALIIFRDVSLVIGAAYYRYISLPLPRTIVRYFDASMPTVNIKPTFISKVNTALQLVLMGSTLAVPALGLNDTKMIQTALQVMQYTVGGTTVLSGLSYLLSKDTIQILRRKRQKNSSITKNIN